MAGTGVGKFSSTAGSNTASMTVNFAENMAPSNVNNAARELMGHMRDMYEQLGDGYFEFGDGDGTYTVARGDADTITITSSADISGIYFPGRKIRITDGGANVVEGTIASSSHSSTTQTVNLTGISLASGTPTKVELGIDTAAFGGRVILDDDGDTYIEAPTDDTIDIYVGGAKDFVITANTFTAESGSTIAAQALTATTIAATSTVTGTSFNGIPFYQGDTGSIYTHDVSGTDSTASQNTAYGLTALDAITTGDNNVAIGFGAATSLNSGAENIAVGKGALNTATTATQCVAIGQNAGYAVTTGGAVNLVAIGHGAYNGAGDTETNNLAIGVSAMLGPSLAGAEYNVAIGNFALDALTSGDNNTVVGYNAGTEVTTGEQNVAIGKDALLAATNDNYNVAIGSSAGLAITGGGNNNTLIGIEAGRALTTGDNNVAVGSEALGNSSGATTENHNTAIGANALASSGLNGAEFNVAVGNYTLDAITSGDSNTCVGYNAGGSILQSDRNCCFGESAGASITTGGENIMIGQNSGNAGTALTTGDTNIFIGEKINAGAAGRLRSIVIGTPNSQSKGDNTTFISANGGTSFNGGNTTTWDQSSDRRIKKNIVDNNIGLDAINKIQVRNFEYRTLEEITDFDNPEAAMVDKQGTQLGAIAQEIEEILPDLITETCQGVKTLNADNLTWYLINAVKELSAEIKALKGE